MHGRCGLLARHPMSTMSGSSKSSRWGPERRCRTALWATLALASADGGTWRTVRQWIWRRPTSARISGPLDCRSRRIGSSSTLDPTPSVTLRLGLPWSGRRRVAVRPWGGSSHHRGPDERSSTPTTSVRRTCFRLAVPSKARRSYSGVRLGAGRAVSVGCRWPVTASGAGCAHRRELSPTGRPV